MSYIKTRIHKDGTEVSSDVRKLNITGPLTPTDNGNGDVELDTNVKFIELEDGDFTGLSDDDILRYDASVNKWVRQAAAPPAPPGTTANAQFIVGEIPVISGSTTIPLDSSTPLITEGTEIWSQAITPVESNSIIGVSTSLTASSSIQNMEIVFALFRNNVCIGSVVGATIEKESGLTVSFTFLTDATDTSEATFSLRAGRGNSNNGSWSINTIVGTNNALGGTLTRTGYSISELTVLGN